MEQIVSYLDSDLLGRDFQVENRFLFSEQKHCRKDWNNISSPCQSGTVIWGKLLDLTLLTLTWF